MTRQFMLNQISKNLITPELSQKEIELYVDLIENGESSAGELAERTNIKRPTVYLTLESLHAKSLVSVIDKGKIKKYVAMDPENLREFFAQRIRTLNEIMPKLKFLSNRLSKKPAVRYFSGIEGAKAAYHETLVEPKTQVRTIGSIRNTKKVFGPDFVDRYIRERVKRKISMDSILGDTPFARKIGKQNKKQLRKLALIDPHLLPKNTEANIWGHKVAFASYGEEPVGIIIENKEFAQLLSTLYDLAVKKTKRYNS